MIENKDNLVTVEHVKEAIRKIKFDIIEKENLIDELLNIINGESE